MIILKNEIVVVIEDIGKFYGSQPRLHIVFMSWTISIHLYLSDLSIHRKSC
jgi:hypothetical protein